MECIWLIVVAEARRTAGKSAFVEVVANSSKQTSEEIEVGMMDTDDRELAEKLDLPDCVVEQQPNVIVAKNA